MNMPLSTKHLIEDLQHRSGATSMSELLRRALALLDVVITEEQRGSELYFHRLNGEQSKVVIL